MGMSFRDKLGGKIPPWWTDEEICDYLMDTAVAIHLKDYEDRFNIICLMVKKLFSLVSESAKELIIKFT